MSIPASGPDPLTHFREVTADSEPGWGECHELPAPPYCLHDGSVLVLEGVIAVGGMFGLIWSYRCPAPDCQRAYEYGVAESEDL